MFLKYGLVLPQGMLYDLPRNPVEAYNFIINMAMKAEELGFNSIWFFDHLQPYPIITRDNVFESLMLLSSIAVLTKRIKIGLLVACSLFRYPTLLAKMSSIIDYISNGRLIFGVGVCWYEREFRRFGINFPKYAERVKMLEEALEITIKSWIQDEVYFRGKYFNIEGFINFPKPKQKPYPPILIGGSSKGLLKIVAKYGDLWNYVGPINKLDERYKQIKAYCNKLGRPCNIKKTYYTWIISGPSRFVVSRRIGKFLFKILSKAISYPTSSIGVLGDFIRKTWRRVGFSLSPETLLVGTYKEVRKKIEIIKSKGVHEVMLYIPLLYEEPNVLEEYVEKILVI